MTDAHSNLGQRILAAARLATVLHLTQAFEQSSRQREQCGEAAPGASSAWTDEPLPVGGDRIQRSPRAGGGAS